MTNAELLIEAFLKGRTIDFNGPSNGPQKIELSAIMTDGKIKIDNTPPALQDVQIEHPDEPARSDGRMIIRFTFIGRTVFGEIVVR